MPACSVAWGGPDGGFGSHGEPRTHILDGTSSKWFPSLPNRQAAPREDTRATESGFGKSFPLC